MAASKQSVFKKDKGSYYNEKIPIQKPIHQNFTEFLIRDVIPKRSPWTRSFNCQQYLSIDYYLIEKYKSKGEGKVYEYVLQKCNNKITGDDYIDCKYGHHYLQALKVAIRKILQFKCIYLINQYQIDQEKDTEKYINQHSQDKTYFNKLTKILVYYQPFAEKNFSDCHKKEILNSKRYLNNRQLFCLLFSIGQAMKELIKLSIFHFDFKLQNIVKFGQIFKVIDYEYMFILYDNYPEKQNKKMKEFIMFMLENYTYSKNKNRQFNQNGPFKILTANSDKEVQIKKLFECKNQNQIQRQASQIIQGLHSIMLEQYYKTFINIIFKLLTDQNPYFQNKKSKDNQFIKDNIFGILKKIIEETFQTPINTENFNYQQIKKQLTKNDKLSLLKRQNLLSIFDKFNKNLYIFYQEPDNIKQQGNNMGGNQLIQYYSDRTVQRRFGMIKMQRQYIIKKQFLQPIVKLRMQLDQKILKFIANQKNYLTTQYIGEEIKINKTKLIYAYLNQSYKINVQRSGQTFQKIRYALIFIESFFNILLWLDHQYIYIPDLSINSFCKKGESFKLHHVLGAFVIKYRTPEQKQMFELSKQLFTQGCKILLNQQNSSKPEKDYIMNMLILTQKELLQILNQCKNNYLMFNLLIQKHFSTIRKRRQSQIMKKALQQIQILSNKSKKQFYDDQYKQLKYKQLIKDMVKLKEAIQSNNVIKNRQYRKIINKYLLNIKDIQPVSIQVQNENTQQRKK